MTNTKGSVALIALLAVFLASRATIALISAPSLSDTRAYALYSFVIRSAVRLGTSPYELYESLARLAGKAQGQPTMRFDQITMEYPPLALALMLPPLVFMSEDRVVASAGSRTTTDLAGWVRGFRWLYFLTDGVTVIGLGLWMRRRGLASAWGLAIVTAAGAVLGSVLYDRLDLWVGLLLLGAIAAQTTGRKHISLACLAVAVNLKLVPLLLLPLFLFGALPSTVLDGGLARRRALRSGLLACGVFTLVAAGIFLPFRLAWGPRVWDFIPYHLQRGLEIESTWSSILLLGAHLGLPTGQLVHAFGAGGIVGTTAGTFAQASVPLVLAATGFVYWRLWRRARRSRVTMDRNAGRTVAEQDPQAFLWACFAVLALAMAASKVFSPQYLCWFIPSFLLLQPPPSWRAAAAPSAFLVACGVTAVIFPGLWTELMPPGPNATYLLSSLRVTLLLLVRNSVWLVFCLLSLLSMQRDWFRTDANAVDSTSCPT